MLVTVPHWLVILTGICCDNYLTYSITQSMQNFLFLKKIINVHIMACKIPIDILHISLTDIHLHTYGESEYSAENIVFWY